MTSVLTLQCLIVIKAHLETKVLVPLFLRSLVSISVALLGAKATGLYQRVRKLQHATFRDNQILASLV